MTKPQTHLTAFVAGVALLVSAASANASPRQLALIQDDAAFVEGSRGDPPTLLREARHQLGADIVRANLYWRAVSPSPRANSKPRGFAVGDPSSPWYRWAMYDHFIANARAAGLRVYLTITGPTPDWGSREPRRCREGCIWKPNSQTVRQVRQGGRAALPGAGSLLVDLERAQPLRLAAASVLAPAPRAVRGADVPLAVVPRLPGDPPLRPGAPPLCSVR
jgi:hypothetical protein